MDIKIGISELAREVSIRSEDSADEIVAQLQQAIENNSLFELSDSQGRKLVIPAAKVAYLDLGASDSRPVGFGAV